MGIFGKNKKDGVWTIVHKECFMGELKHYILLSSYLDANEALKSLKDLSENLPEYVSSKQMVIEWLDNSKFIVWKNGNDWQDVFEVVFSPFNVKYKK